MNGMEDLDVKVCEANLGEEANCIIGNDCSCCKASTIHRWPN
jgi:hypothetical protein